jgi:hypothetical protein
MKESLQVAAACVTVKVIPAMVNVPTRLAVALFAETKYVTLPSPLPVAPDTILIQPTLLTAVQEHPAGEVTPTEAFPPE